MVLRGVLSIENDVFQIPANVIVPVKGKVSGDAFHAGMIYDYL